MFIADILQLWMGTHTKAPSMIAETNVALSQYLKEHESAIGDNILKRFKTHAELPYLFKVLSVNKALSIQAHPNKKHAEELHAAHPDRYPDPNHKPEMAIALTPFEAMCGFRPKSEIKHFFKGINTYILHTKTVSNDL